MRLVDGEVGAMGEVGSPTGANQHVRNVDNINIPPTKGGTDPTYLLARMKRDAPEGNANATKNNVDNINIVLM